MFGNFTEEARKVLVMAKKEMTSLKHPYVGSEHLLLAILKKDNIVSEKLKDYNLDYNRMREEIINTIGIGKRESEWFLYTPLLKRVIENAIVDSKENNNGEVKIEHLFSSLLEEGEGVAIRIMLSMNIDIDELYNDFVIQISTPKKKKNKKKLLLEELGVDLTKKAMEGKLDPVIGREVEIKRILEVLSRRTKNNPILIGEAGVGKTAIVEELSRLIVSGDVPMSLRNKRIISLDMATAVAGTKYRGEFEDRIRKILKEIESNDDIILFIDEIHTLVTASKNGDVDFLNMLKPGLDRGDIKIIGATTTQEFEENLLKDKAFLRRFERIEVAEPDQETTVKILMGTTKKIEKSTGVRWPYTNWVLENVCKFIVDMTSEYKRVYENNSRYPDVSLALLSKCFTYARFENSDIVTFKHIYAAIKNCNSVYPDVVQKELVKFKEEFKEFLEKEKVEL